MIKDCINLFSAAFCCTDTMTLAVLPDSDVYQTAQFINALSGRCSINKTNGTALLKPLKKFPASCPSPLHQAGREVFFLIAGIVAQLGLTVKIESLSPEVSHKELVHLSNITQNALMICREGSAVYLSSMLMNENPLFPHCEIPEFSAGLCIGAILARSTTLVDLSGLNGKELIEYTLETLENYGALIYPDMSARYTVVKTLKRTRFAGNTKKPENNR